MQDRGFQRRGGTEGVLFLRFHPKFTRAGRRASLLPDVTSVNDCVTRTAAVVATGAACGRNAKRRRTASPPSRTEVWHRQSHRQKKLLLHLAARTRTDPKREQYSGMWCLLNFQKYFQHGKRMSLQDRTERDASRHLWYAPHCLSFTPYHTGCTPPSSPYLSQRAH